jgi:hypothetical protein
MKHILTIAALLTFGAVANAKVGPAGCGLGNVVFGKDTQILAATTNGTSGNQTFGITSGTSNCTAGGGVAQLESFIEVNQVALANDVARGEGETITTLAAILGCNDASKLGTELKGNYQDIFSRPAATPAELSNGVQNAVEKNAELSKSCGNV